jgi:macrolide transport system ATP-binding/permease protein
MNWEDFFYSPLKRGMDYMKELLKLTNISYEVLDQNIFEKVNATVQQGEIIGIIGKNGAGKSTLLQLINNDLEPAHGQIQWLQQDVKVFMVEQEVESHSSEDKTPSEVKLLDKMHVPSHDFRQLSGGEKLKARLAKGLSKDADY